MRYESALSLNRPVAPPRGLGAYLKGDDVSNSYDITLRFDNGQPSYTIHIGTDRKARDAEHAVTLAKLDVSARGWDIKHCDEVFIVGHNGKVNV